MSEENSKKQDTKKNRNEYMKNYMKEYRAKNREKLNLKRRINHEAKSLAKKAKKLINKDAEIEAEIKKGNLNYGIQENEMTFEEYKKFWAQFNEKVSFESYIKSIEEKRFRKQQIEKEVLRDDAFKIIANVPVMRQTSNQCLRFRGMYMKKLEFDALFIDSHMICPACKYWYAQNKNQLPLRRVRGVNLWQHEPIPEEKTCDQDILIDEMNKLYGNKHNHRLDS